ncbi:MAG TPA: tetratricopeptide repeat protein [Salinisphaera sp.]|nr:tetratricopeptide repeat protein [Salinisphaera sp.]HET7314797.1 tetratricopeptide repeat protein [Salinisphaera sp.]
MQDRLQAMIDAGQDTPLARFTLGELLHKNGDHAAAITHLAAAVEQDGEYSAAWKLYGRVLLEAGEIDAAIDTLTRGIEVAGRRGDNQAAKEMQVFLKRARRAAK